jgi:hypothetical protein
MVVQPDQVPVHVGSTTPDTLVKNSDVVILYCIEHLLVLFTSNSVLPPDLLN